jgi:xylulokinase
MRAVLGIDIGTQGVKAAAFTEDGSPLATQFRSSRLHRPAPGVVEEDPEYQFASVCDVILECAQSRRLKGANVVALAIDGQMAGIIGVGKDGRAVTPYDSWLDTRCAPYIDVMNRKAGEEVIAKSGGPASFNHGPKILWWMRERKSAFRRIASFVQPGGYAAMRLCGFSGAEAYIDNTYLHFSGFADTVNEQWDVDLCRRFGVPLAKLPRITRPHEVLGEMVPAMARRCGLKAGVKVVAGCGDTAASFLACGATREGVCVDVAGTAGVFAATAGSFRPDTRHHTLSCGHAATPGLWHPYAYVNGAGMNLEWFAELLSFAANGKSKQDLFGALDKAAERGATQGGLVFIPHLGGRVSPSWPSLRGAWAGMDWSHKAPDLWRGMLEGVAFEYAIYRKVLGRLYPRLRMRELRVTGGGEKSALWNQIKADMLNTPVVRVGRGEGAPLGAALLAAHGAGMATDLDAVARRWIPRAATTRPQARRRSHYADQLRRYEALLNALNDWSGL